MKLELHDEAADKPRLPPVHPSAGRFSLLGLIWLVTVAALGFGLYRIGQEIVPLRTSNAQLRQELGYFPVDDPTKTHVRRVRVKDPVAWQWRFYLPMSRTYSLNYFVGTTPDPLVVGKDKWFDFLRENSRSVDNIIESGEFGYDAIIMEFDGRPWLRAGKLADLGSTFGLPSGAEWLMDRTAWKVSSEASYEGVKTFDPGRPVVLLEIEQKSADDASDADSMETQASNAKATERFLLWLDLNQPMTSPVVSGVVR